MLNDELLIQDLARLARLLAKQSPCKRRGVACVVFDSSGQIVGWGVNEPAHGRICSGEKDNCGCLHSEVNTILNTRPRNGDVNNSIVCSRAPCVPCASVLVNCGFISEVFILDESEPGAHGIGLLKNAGITVDWLDVPEGAEVGLRDPAMKPSGPPLEIAKLQAELAQLEEQIARGEGSFDMVAKAQEIRKQIKQVS